MRSFAYCFVLFGFALIAVQTCTLSAADKYWTYFGTYTGAKSEGIYVAEFDTISGKLGAPKLAAKVAQPSFVAIHPSAKYLYAVNETAEFKKEKVGAISAFSIHPTDGTLTLLNDASSGGGGPCHLVVDSAGKHVLAANYGGGSVCAYAIEADGKLGKRTGFIQHTGSSVNPARQKEPHAHSINLDAANQFAFSADLGLDKILIYKFDKATGSLTPNDPAFGRSPAGGGPRHFAFNPVRNFAYANNEMLNSVTTYQYDAAKGELTPSHTVTTLPSENVTQNSTAEVRVHPSGKFVYVSNRGHNSIAIFQVEEKTGRLIPTGHQGEGVNVPRNFNIDPSGKWMLVANQQGDSVVVFAINGETGALQPTGEKIEVGSPVCVRFLAK